MSHGCDFEKPADRARSRRDALYMTMSPALGRRCLTSGISIAWLGATGIGDRILWLPGYEYKTTANRQMASRRQQDGSGLGAR